MLVVAVGAALTFSAVSLAGLNTTAPSKKITAMVLINDQGIKVFFFAGALGVDGEPEPNTAIAVTTVPRGGYVSFDVYNRGHTVHNFRVFGKKTPPIKPGGKAHLFSAANTRGVIPYESTLDRGTRFHGTFTVY